MRRGFLPWVSLLLAAGVVLTDAGTAQPVLVQKDNNIVGGYHNSLADGWEESVLLGPAGPCRVLELRIYMMGSTAKSDTIWITGDASEGAVPPTGWVWHYNALLPPIIFPYDGQQGWKTIDLRSRNFRIEGHQRICVQHRYKPGGPYFAVDADRAGTPYTSFLMTPYESSFPPQYNLPGKYYLAGGDFMIRLLVEYDFPSGSTSQPPPAPTLVDVTSEAGLMVNGQTIKSVQASIVDVDNDGRDDIAIGATLFRNRGNGSFENVSAAAGLSGGGTIWGDFDNDGWIDCFAAAGWGNDKLYRNNGNGTFSDVTAASGIVNNYPTMSPVWLDYDGDGRLDLFIANNRREESGVETYYPDQLWRNEGNGAFRNVTAASGIAAGEPAPYYDCYGAAACDYNNDGNIDIFVANYRLAPDNLYRNNGDGTFTEVGAATGVRGVATANPGYFGHGMGCEWADVNNDGYPDLTVGNLGHPDVRGLVSNPSLLFLNEGAPTYRFTDRHTEMGLRFYEMNAGVCWLDLENDGDLDVWHGQISYSAEGSGGEPKRRGRIYENLGAPDFTLREVTWKLGMNVHGPWTAVRLDYDLDGDLDLLVASSHEGVKLFRNDIPGKGSWIAVRLAGSPANGVPADGYGARVHVRAGGRSVYRELPGGGAGSRATQNSSELFFGTGTADRIDTVIVSWPDGTSRAFPGLAINRRHRINYDGTVITDATPPPVPAAGWEVADVRAGATALSWTLRSDTPVPGLRVDVYTVLGTRVASLPARDAHPGVHSMPLGGTLPSGVYIVRFGATGRTAAARITVVR